MASSTKVTRVKAADDAPKKAKKAPKAPNIFVRIARYFTGAWQELKLVRWPNRKATWSLTLAVILFSLFFVFFILLLDTFFKYLFQLIIT